MLFRSPRLGKTTWHFTNAAHSPSTMAAQGFTHSLKKHQGLAASPKTDLRGPGCSLAWEPFNQSWRITVFHWQHFYLRSMACPSKYMASYFKEIKSELVIIYSYVCKHLLKFISYFKKSHQYHFSRPSPLRSKKLAAHLILEGSQRGPQMRRISITWELVTIPFPGSAPDLMNQKF